MTTWLPALALLAAAPAVIDSLIRLALHVVARRHDEEKTTGEAPARWLVLIPARSEGTRVVPTLESIRVAASGRPVHVCLLLDGPDAEAEVAAAQTEIVVKTPAGPTKGAALGWFAANCAGRLQAVDAVLLVDVGSRLDPSFFQAFRWQTDDDASQARIRGAGSSAGAAVTASEAIAQSGEDAGRDAIRWSARIRGTGTVLRPAAFQFIAPHLRTQVEDLEASLLLAAAGSRIALAPPGCRIEDDKPSTMRTSALQRARWMAGRIELCLTRGPALARLIARRPLEGLAFAAELFGRPLSLSAPLRLVAAALGVAHGSTLALSAAVINLLTVVSDVALHLRGGGLRGLPALAGSWLLAIVLLPSAFVRWLGARRS